MLGSAKKLWLLSDKLCLQSNNTSILLKELFIASNYNLKIFKIVKNCFHISDLIKLEAICILLRKPKLCKHKDFDYTVSLFSQIGL